MSDMDIERLKELNGIVALHVWLSGKAKKDLTALIDEAITRQSKPCSEEVAEAIETLETQNMGTKNGYKKWAEKINDGIDWGKYINANNLAIAALKEYEPWISVNDRLPEEKTLVMIAYGEAIYFASIQYWGIHGKEVPVWRVGMGHRIEKDFSETHWKPYPETPKGE